MAVWRLWVGEHSGNHLPDVLRLLVEEVSECLRIVNGADGNRQRARFRLLRKGGGKEVFLAAQQFFLGVAEGVRQAAQRARGVLGADLALVFAAVDDARAAFFVQAVFGAGEEGAVEHHRLCAADDGGDDVGRASKVAPDDERFGAVGAHLLQQRERGLFDVWQVVGERRAFAARFHALQDEGIHAEFVGTQRFEQVADDGEGEDALFATQRQGFAVGQTLREADGARADGNSGVKQIEEVVAALQGERFGVEASLQQFGGEGVGFVALRLLRQAVREAKGRRGMVFAVGVGFGAEAVARVVRGNADDAMRALGADAAGHVSADEVEGEWRLPEGVLAAELFAQGVGDEVHA